LTCTRRFSLDSLGAENENVLSKFPLCRIGALINDAVNRKDDTVKSSLNVHILATWSSGSTFLTKLLTHYPGVFLTFEPLVLFNTYDALENKHVNSSLSLLRDIFRCNYAGDGFGGQFLSFIKNPTLGSSQSTPANSL